MKINIVLPEFGLSGGVMVALKYACALEQRGHDVMCYGKRLPYIKPKKIKNVAHALHRLVSNYDIRIAQKRCGTFTFQEPFFITNKSIRDADAVIATAWCTAYDVSRLSEAKGKKYYFIQDYEIWDNREKGINSYRLNLKHIVIAKWIDDILINEHGCEPATIIYNGIDLEIFKPRKERIKSENITISMMYHLLPKKGINDGLRILRDIHNVYPKIRMILFGKPNFEDKPDYIEYVRDPIKEQLVNIYQQSDIFLFPARKEGWGLTVIEAMACGCAVVGTNTGALLEIGVNNVNALISDPGEIEILEDNIIRVIQDEKLRKKIGQNAVETVQELTWEKAFDKFERTLCN